MTLLLPYPRLQLLIITLTLEQPRLPDPTNMLCPNTNSQCVSSPVLPEHILVELIAAPAEEGGGQGDHAGLVVVHVQLREDGVELFGDGKGWVKLAVDVRAEAVQFVGLFVGGWGVVGVGVLVLGVGGV